MLGSFFHWLGYGLCHQLPSRSFFAGGWQVPVCARDTGIYAGFALSLALIAALERGRRPAGLPAPWLLVAGSAGVLAMVVDGVTSYAGVRETTNAIRLATGLAAGWAMPLVVVPMLHGQLWRRWDDVRLLEGRKAAAWLAGLPLAFAAIYWLLPRAGVMFPLLVSVAILATLAVVNLVFVSLIPAFERSASSVRSLAPQVAVAAVLTGLELVGAALLRSWLEHAIG
ncbi:MAG: DUF2085 domain-containing protein [Coriobacteriia bacterium]|nr:DUF2085 domain-containing protein [Coriobacteriia bacterium]